MKDDGGPAFPVPEPPWARAIDDMRVCGMSLRDYFAAKAMQAIIIKADDGSTCVTEIGNWLGEYAYEAADAMLEARKKR
jgi:hypothetical protein